MKWNEMSIGEKAGVIKMFVESGVEDLGSMRKLWDAGVEYAGGGSIDGVNKDPYKAFLDTLPSNLRNGGDEYNMRRYWELNGMPRSFAESPMGMFSMEGDGYYHANSVAYNPTSGNYEFMKGREHPTHHMELDWYWSDDPSAVEFRKNYRYQPGVGMMPDQYVPVRSFAEGGDTKEPPIYRSKIGTLPEVKVVPYTGRLITEKPFRVRPYTGHSMIQAESPYEDVEVSKGPAMDSYNVFSSNCSDNTSTALGYSHRGFTTPLSVQRALLRNQPNARMIEDTDFRTVYEFPISKREFDRMRLVESLNEADDELKFARESNNAEDIRYFESMMREISDEIDMNYGSSGRNFAQGGDAGEPTSGKQKYTRYVFPKNSGLWNLMDIRRPGNSGRLDISEAMRNNAREVYRRQLEDYMANPNKYGREVPSMVRAGLSASQLGIDLNSDDGGNYLEWTRQAWGNKDDEMSDEEYQNMVNVAYRTLNSYQATNYTKKRWADWLTSQGMNPNKTPQNIQDELDNARRINELNTRRDDIQRQSFNAWWNPGVTDLIVDGASLAFGAAGKVHPAFGIVGGGLEAYDYVSGFDGQQDYGDAGNAVSGAMTGLGSFAGGWGTKPNLPGMWKGAKIGSMVGSALSIPIDLMNINYYQNQHQADVERQQRELEQINKELGEITTNSHAYGGSIYPLLP